MAESELSLEQLFELGIDELYVTVGKVLIGEHRDAISTKKPPYLRAGKEWLRQKRKSLAKLICQNKRIQMLMLQKNVNRTILASAVLDLILSMEGTVAPATVAVLLVKEGIDTLCEGFTSQEDKT